MTREDAIRIATGLRTDFKCESDTMVDFCSTIIEALKQEPCDDCVSRQAVLEQTYSWCKDEFLRTTNPFDYLRKRINSLPPIQPKAKAGKWIKYGRPRCDEQHYQCTACNYYINFGKWGDLYTKEFRYCPNCGAKMEVDNG